VKQTTLSAYQGSKKGVIERSKKGSKKSTPNTVKAMNTLFDSGKQSKDSVQWHKSHRYLFIFQYKGAQPTRHAKISKIGRYRTVIQAKFEYPEYKAIVFALPKTIKIWVKHPKGTKTKEQLTRAHRIAWEVAESFSRKHGIAIMNEREAGFSEHTVERKALDSRIRPVVEQAPELAKERLGLSINQTSHKGRVEWTGKRAKQRVMALERMLDGGVDEILHDLGLLMEGQTRQFDLWRALAKSLKKPEPPDMKDGGMFG